MIVVQLIESAFRGFHAQSILDVGPGYADFSRAAARVTGAREITFVDVSQDVLAWQSQRTLEAGFSPRLVKGFLEPELLETVAGSFDIIHCQEVLEHLPRAEQVLESLVHLLSPRGRLVVTVPTAASERWLTFINPSYMKDEPYGHVNRFSAEGIRELLRQAGLSIIHFQPIHPEYFIGHSWLVGTRMRIEGSTGNVLTRGLRGFVYGNLTKYSGSFFAFTGRGFWERLIPRNYFIIAQRHDAVR